MKLKLKNTPEQAELIRATASKNRLTAEEAMETLAAFLGPVVNKILLSAGTSNLLYETFTFNEDDSPSYPLDLFQGEDVGLVPVYSQSIAGGIPHAILEGSGEMKIATYPLDTIFGYMKKYARKSRLDVISKFFERATNELLIKQELNAWAVVLKAVAEATTNGADQIILSNTQNVFIPDDISRLITLVKRINMSFSGNTPSNFDAKGLTDLFVSPEIKEQIRGFAYNPVNKVGSQSTGPVTLPESTRQGIYNSVGTDEIFGVNITDLVELGTTRKYNVLFGQFAPASVSFSSANFDSANDEVLIGVDLGQTAAVRPLAQGAGGGTLEILPDEFHIRSEKVGYYCHLEEGRAVVNSKPYCALIV